MRVALVLVGAAHAFVGPPRRCAPSVVRHRASLDAIDAEYGALHRGLAPSDAFTPLDVAALTLRSLRRRGAAFPLATAEFSPAGGAECAQYDLLVDGGYVCDLEDDVLDLGDTAFLQARLDDASTGELLVRLGWDFVRRDGCWLTSGWSWHDFRPDFHPGVGQEAWTRICG